MDNTEIKDSWLQRTTGLNVWSVMFWAAFAVAAMVAGDRAQEAIFKKTSFEKPIVPTVVDGYAPTGGYFLDMKTGKYHRIESLRGSWTLLMFSSYSCPSWVTDYSRCVKDANQHYEATNTALEYFHKKLSPHGVKVWLVRVDIDNDPRFDDREPRGPHDRYLWIDATNTQHNYLMDNWVLKTRGGQVDVGGTPFFAMLDPAGGLRFMVRRTLNLHVVNAVFEVMGKHDLVQNTLVDHGSYAPLYEEDQRVHGLLNIQKRDKFLIRTRSSGDRTLYSVLFQVAFSNNTYRKPDMELAEEIALKPETEETYRPHACALCGGVLLQPAKYLLFNVKPELSRGTEKIKIESLPDRTPFDFMNAQKPTDADMNVAKGKQ